MNKYIQEEGRKINIGLVRHFKVICNTKNFMTSEDFKTWTQEYENSEVIENKVNIESIKWDKCFSSDLLRAVKTSQAIFKGKVVQSDLLREVPISPIFETNLKLPYIFWCINGRIAWLFNSKSQMESKRDTEKRAKEFLDNIENEEGNILIVCHGFFMYILQKELKKRGFNGKNIRKAKNGTLYLYKK